MKNNTPRGFKALVGEKIVKVDSSCINAIKFLTESGKLIEIDCDEQLYGIGVMNCTVKEVKK